MSLPDRFAHCLGVLFAAAILAASTATPGAAQQAGRIAAVVNDQVISVFDLNERIKMALYSSGLPDTPDQRQRMAQRVLRTLIDETIRAQEARRRNISLTKPEVFRAYEMLERRNKLKPGKFADFLIGNGLDPTAVDEQIRANLMWDKLLNRRIVPTIDIGEEQIDAALERLKARQGQMENLVSEIFLAIDSMDDEAPALLLAERLKSQIELGADFAAVAGQFGQSASAAVGGDIGWVQEGLLGAEMDMALADMQPGTVSTPIRTPDGIQILQLRDRRRIEAPGAEDAEVSLRQFILALRENSPRGEVESQIQLAKQIAASATTCDEFSQLAAEAGTPQPTRAPRVRVGDLSNAVRAAIAGLGANDVTEPVIMPTAVLVLMLCEHHDAAIGPVREQVVEQIGRERLDMLARRYLRDLRREAYIDIRLRFVGDADR